MAQTPDFHLKLLIGDLAAQIAILRAENERLRELVPSNVEVARPSPYPVERSEVG